MNAATAWNKRESLNYFAYRARQRQIAPVFIFSSSPPPRHCQPQENEQNDVYVYMDIVLCSDCAPIVRGQSRTRGWRQIVKNDSRPCLCFHLVPSTSTAPPARTTANDKCDYVFKLMFHVRFASSSRGPQIIWMQMNRETFVNNTLIAGKSKTLSDSNWLHANHNRNALKMIKVPSLEKCRKNF